MRFTNSVSKTVLTITILFFSISNATGQMRRIYLDTFVAENHVQNMSFYSASEGYVAFRNWIGYTTDSGRSYTKKYISIGNVDYNGYSVNLTFGFEIQGATAINQGKILVYGHYGYIPSILYSINGGSSYKLVFHSQFSSGLFSGAVNDINFPQNGNIGYATDNDRILKTTDQGLTWTVIKSDPSAYFGLIKAIDNNTIFVPVKKQNAHTIVKTADGGLTWANISLPLSSPTRMNDVFFKTALTGWLTMFDLNQNEYVYKTINGGANWILQNNLEATPFNGYFLTFQDDNIGYSLAQEQNTIYKTFNSGVTWEPLPRDNNYAYLGYSHNYLQRINTNQLWAGGAHGFLELTTNASGNTLPKAYFRIDTIGVRATNIVNLVNYSRTGYQYKWFVNSVLISTNYNPSYTHNSNRAFDTIQLVVNNGIQVDTVKKIQSFNLPVIISSFSPAIALTGTVINIVGTNLNGATNVKFGGVPASGFTQVSPLQITAMVGTGASGNVTVITPQGIGSLNGFTYYNPPMINLPTNISDSILCKSEKITVAIQNTEPNVRYDLIDSLNNSYGFINSNGGNVAFLTSAISRAGNYTIRATRLDIASSSTFTNKFYIKVEHTFSAITANRSNVVIGEKLNFSNQSIDAQSFIWSFYQDPNISSSNQPNPQNIFYSSIGQKTLSLISTSANGCKDTLNTNSTYVYNKPLLDDICYSQNIDDSDFVYTPQSPTYMNKIVLAKDNGYYINGKGNSPKLKSRYGVIKAFNNNSIPYFAKYTTNGVLSWSMFINSDDFGSQFKSLVTDSFGNIYVTGYCYSNKFLILPNGDSMRISAGPSDAGQTYIGRPNGFILKLDTAGNYIWHTIIENGYSSNIILKENQIIVSGIFNSNLSYTRNGITQTMIQVPNAPIAKNSFILKIKGDGSLSWHMYFESNSVNLGVEKMLSGIAIDKFKKIYISGLYENSITLHDAGSINNFTYNGVTSTYRSFLFQFDSTGKLQWKMNFIDTSFIGQSIQINDIASDRNGNSFVTGVSSNYNNSRHFQITNSNGTINNVSIGAYFLLKIDSSGIFKWAVGSKYCNYGEGLSITLNESNIYTTGYLANYPQSVSTIDMTSTDNNTFPVRFYLSEFFVANYDTSGILKRVVRSGQNVGGYLFPNTLILDNYNNILMSGLTTNNNGGNSTFNCFNSILSTNKIDGFFTKLSPSFCYSTNPPIANAGNDLVICQGDSVQIGSNTTNIQTNSYYWTSNPIGFISTQANPKVSPGLTSTYFLTVLSQGGYIARDTVLVTSKLTPIANAGNDQNICTGNSTTIGSSGTIGNNYTWTSNPVGFNSNLANPTVSPTINTRYFLSVTNTVGCTKMDTVIINVSNTLIPSITIATPTRNVCQSVNVTFTSTIIDGGPNPSYQWKIDGTNAGTNSNIFTTNALVMGNIVSCVLTSNSTCANPANATSNSITMIVFSSPTPIISISGNTIVTQGQSSLISSTNASAGNAPTFQWQDSTNLHTWQNILNALAPTINYTPLQTGNKIRCRITSNDACANPPIVNSNVLTFTVNTTTAINPLQLSKYGVKFYPNPVNSILVIDSLKLSDGWQTLDIDQIDGKKFLNNKNIKGQFRVQINVESLASGVYLATLRNKLGLVAYWKFIKQ
jgi:photosystem II stability/assembly factor-like uncharacterized protein